MCEENYPSLIVRAKIEAIENIEELIPGIASQFVQGGLETMQTMASDGIAAYKDFDSHGNLQSLDQAISKFEAIAEKIPTGSPMMPHVLNNLGSFFLCRFERLGEVRDMSKAIEQLEIAVGLTPDDDSDKPSRLSNLGNSLVRRFERLGNMEDIDGAITQQQAAVHLTPDGHPDKPSRLNNLGTSLVRRFERLGNMEDIDGAITQQQAAVHLTPDGHPSKPSLLNNLGNCLLTRFERLGNMEDIDGAITQQQAAVHLIPNGHPDKPHYLNNLGNSLFRRFERLGNMEDIDGAITQQQAAVHLIPNGHPSKPGYLNNLGTCLQTRFERLGNMEDIDGAITQQQAAVHLTPDGHPDKPSRLNNLGISLRTRFERLGNMEDIDGAITQQQAAVHLTPDGHPDKPGRLNNLGNSLFRRFERLGNMEDSERALTQQQAAIHLTPDGHFNKSGYSSNLGTSYHIRFLRFRHPQDAEAAISHFSASATSSVGPPATRFKAVRKWISIASLVGHHSLLNAYERAFELIPLVAWLGIPILDRHEHLIQIGEIVRDAAATAISFGQYDKAVEWLEQGRSIVWNQILQLRTPVDELQAINSVLAGRLVEVSRLLDRGAEQDGSLGSIEESAQRYRALTKEWESIIEQVRSLPSFEDFLKPPKISKLMDAAQNGPIVVLNVTEKRCDALALVPGMDEVVHIPLLDVTYKRVTELRDEMKDVLYTNGLRLRGDRAAQQWTDEGQSSDCKGILDELWNGVVKPVLDSLAFSVRFIQFVVSGPLINVSLGPS
jgi:tetratricopeptide (TPR) repeat protein